jgi:ligand-binding sensor domain-containing protein
MKKTIPMLLVLVSLFSCERSDEPAKSVIMNFKHYALEGYDVTSVALDNLGNAWFGTYNAFRPGDVNKPELIKFNIESNSTVFYDASNSLIMESMFIWDIAVDSKNNVWIGSDGLIRFDGVEFTKFTTENSDIPEDFIHSIAMDSRDNMWFSSSRVSVGGLVMYDGTNWNVFTPDNSGLSMNGVKSIAIDDDDNVWVAQFGYVGQASLVKFTGDAWTAYTNEELGFAPGQWGNITVDSKKHVLGAIDYTFTDPVYSKSGPHIVIFDGDVNKQIRNDSFRYIDEIFVDNEDNIWCMISNAPGEPRGSTLAVFDGNNWLIDSLTFKNTRIETIVQSNDDRIWLGTAMGVYINN